MAVLGLVGIVDKGTYSAQETYQKGNFVLYNGSTWLALKNNLTGAVPEEGENWKYLARGFAAELLSLIAAVDTSGLIGTAGASVSAQSLLDNIADAVATKLVKKAMMSNVQVNDENMVPTSALVYAMAQSLSDMNSNFTDTNNLKVYYDANVTFDFDNPNTAPGMYRLRHTALNVPSEVGMTYGNVLVIKHSEYDTLTMIAMPYGQNQMVFRSGNTNNWASLPWSKVVTNSDLAATKMSIVQTTDEASIDNAYNNWSSSISNATYYKGAILHNIVHSVLGGGTWLLEGYKHDSAYEWQEIRSYDNDGIKNYCRSKMAGTWKPWVAK